VLANCTKRGRDGFEFSSWPAKLNSNGRRVSTLWKDVGRCACSSFFFVREDAELFTAGKVVHSGRVVGSERGEGPVRHALPYCLQIPQIMPYRGATNAFRPFKLIMGRRAFDAFGEEEEVLWAGFGVGGEQARLGFSYGRDGCGGDMWTIRMVTEVRVAREMMG
jgi:hypothetical protein